MTNVNTLQQYNQTLLRDGADHYHAAQMLQTNVNMLSKEVDSLR
jgi:hypothetical protein